MIISTSRRTDIPAYYSKWFFNRINAGEVYVLNPMNPEQAHRVSLREEDVDCFVFHTKNPRPILEQINKLAGFHYYFIFTLNPYGTDIEPSVPNKNKLVETFIELSEKIGKERVIWRYDPILFNSKYTMEYHVKWFEELCKRLSNHTEKVIFSFLEKYSKIIDRTNHLKFEDVTLEHKQEIALYFSRVAKKYGLIIETCTEEYSLEFYGIEKGMCTNPDLIYRISGKKVNYEKDKYQRGGCNCVASADIGAYNSCLHFCRYCYANYDNKEVQKTVLKHDPNSKILIGQLSENVKIYEKKIKQRKTEYKDDTIQLTLF